MQPQKDIEKEKKSAFQAMDDIKAKMPQKSGDQSPKNCLGNNQPPQSVEALSLLSHSNDLQDSSSNSIGPQFEDLNCKKFGYTSAIRNHRKIKELNDLDSQESNQLRNMAVNTAGD